MPKADPGYHSQPIELLTRHGVPTTVQSLVREDAHRSILFDLDMAIVRLRQAVGDSDAVISLTAVYHNLLRQWAEV
jgi:PKHD-type hydroxylase